MNSYRKNAIIAGILWIIGTAAGVLTFPFLGVVDKPDYLIRMSENAAQVTTGAILILIMAISCASIAIWLYPVLKKQSEALALGSVGFRLIEGALDVVLVIILMSLLSLSQEYVKAGAVDTFHFQTLGTLLLAAREWTFGVCMLIPFGVGALMYYVIFYQSKLIPRWLSVWGIIAILLHIATAVLVMFDILDPESTLHTVINMPIAVQEMVIAVWLIVKGFNIPAIVSISRKQTQIG